ncbi:MAG: heparin lyase I family protein [Pseudomonadota bacterium]
MHQSFSATCFFAALLYVVSPVAAAGMSPIAADNFESGKASALWNSFAYVTVKPLPAATGRSGNGLAFGYVGNPVDTRDATAEARFDLKKEYVELAIEYDLFIPANYKHITPSDRADNNKFLRLWQVSYSVGEQIGAGTLPQGLNGESKIGTDYKKFPDWGVSTAIKQADNFITLSDLGQWMTVKIHVKAPSDKSKGVIQIYKNGNLLLNDVAVPNNLPGLQGWRYGYLFGWANSGFREDTVLYIDNVKFSGETIAAFRSRALLPVFQLLF